MDSGKKKDEGFAQIGYCEFRKNNKNRKEVQIPHGKCNTGHEVQAIPNVLREEIWRVGLQYILDSEKKKDEGFAQIGYCEFRKNNKDRKEVQIPHGKCNTGHEVQAIPNVLREEIWRSTSVAEI